MLLLKSNCNEVMDFVTCYSFAHYSTNMLLRHPIYYGERPSHPQYIRGILKVANGRWRIGVSYDAVGCVSRRATSPVPLVPEINRMEQGLDSGVE